MDKHLVIGADIGGSHISVACVDLRNKKLIPETQVKLEVDGFGPANTILNNWGKALGSVLQKCILAEVRGIACAIPGPFDYKNGIAHYAPDFKFGALHGRNLSKAIGNDLGLSEPLPILFLNDATSFAVGETINNHDLSKQRVLCVTLGTGLGAGFVNNAKPVFKGEMVPKNGSLWPLPYRKGLADDYFSTRGILGLFHQKGGEHVEGVKDIAEKAPFDVLAQDTLEEFGQEFGCFLSGHLKRFHADALVIGGNIAKAYKFFGPALEHTLANNLIEVEIFISKNVESSAILGAALLYDNRLEMGSPPQEW